jgi:hypothetical protein
MAVLRWDTINRNQNSDLIKTLVANNQQIGNSLKGLGTTADEYVTDKTDQNTKDFMGQLMAAETDAERSAMIDAAKNQDFLDFGAIGEKNYELGADSRALETQLAAEDRANTRADFVNTREIEEEKQAVLFADKIEDANQKQNLSDELYLGNIDNIRANDLLDKEIGANIKALEDDFKRDEERAKREAKEREAALILTAANSQAELEIKENAKKELKIELAKIKAEAERKKLKLSNERKDNEKYLEEIGAIPSGLNGIFTKANGGLPNTTRADVGATAADIAAYNDFRTEVFKSLGYQPSNATARAQFDRWAADNITFNDNSIFGGNNDFKFGDVNFGKSFQTSDANIKSAVLAFTDSKVAYDTKNSVYEWYTELAEDKGGSGLVREFDADWSNFASNSNGFRGDRPLTAQLFKEYMISLLGDEAVYDR